jgi:hypothetical protein
LEGRLAVCDLGQNAVEVVSRERPVKRLRDLTVVLFEGCDPGGAVGQVGDVIGGQRLALQDRDVDLDLV